MSTPKRTNIKARFPQEMLEYKKENELSNDVFFSKLWECFEQYNGLFNKEEIMDIQQAALKEGLTEKAHIKKAVLGTTENSLKGNKKTIPSIHTLKQQISVSKLSLKKSLNKMTGLNIGMTRSLSPRIQSGAILQSIKTPSDTGSLVKTF